MILCYYNQCFFTLNHPSRTIEIQNCYAKRLQNYGNLIWKTSKVVEIAFAKFGQLCFCLQIFEILPNYLELPNYKLFRWSKIGHSWKCSVIKAICKFWLRKSRKSSALNVVMDRNEWILVWKCAFIVNRLSSQSISVDNDDYVQGQGLCQVEEKSGSSLIPWKFRVLGYKVSGINFFW